MPRNNKRKKKLSNFKKFLCIYCGILLLAGVITLIMLHSLLKDYEEGMPSGTMDKIVNQFTPDGIGKLLSDNSVKVNEFETNDTITSYFTDKLNDGTVVGYGDTYTFFCGSDIELTPVMTAVQQKTTVKILSATPIEGTVKVSFLATRNVAPVETVVKQGFVYGKNLADS